MKMSLNRPESFAYFFQTVDLKAQMSHAALVSLTVNEVNINSFLAEGFGAFQQVKESGPA